MTDHVENDEFLVRATIVRDGSASFVDFSTVTLDGA
jgi:hypothetical protein